MRLDKVNSIKLSTRSVQWFSPLDIHFEMSAKENQKVVCFRHPLTGIKYTLYFQNAEFIEMPLGVDGNRSFYAAQTMYEIEPELPQGDTLQFNSSIQYTGTTEDRFNPTATSSIGIIGGADGPIAIFVSPAGEEKMFRVAYTGYYYITALLFRVSKRMISRTLFLRVSIQKYVTARNITFDSFSAHRLL